MTGDGRKCQVNLALRGRAGRAAGRSGCTRWYATPAARHLGPDLLAFTELAARPAEGRSRSRRGDRRPPEDPPKWSAWQLLAPHAAVVLNSLSALPDSSDETIGAVADTAYMAARYRASQGSYAAAAAEYGEVFHRPAAGPAPRPPVHKGQHPSAATVMRMLRDHDEDAAVTWGRTR